MSTWFLVISLTIALVGAIGVVAFESPTRSAGGLLTAFVGVAAAAGAVGAPVVPGFVLWVGGGGIGLLLLGAVLLLNLGEDERGPRRLRLRPTLTAPLLALLWSALAGPLVTALPERTAAAAAEASAGLTSAAVAAVLVDDLALPATAGLVALAASLIVAVALVRRRT